MDERYLHPYMHRRTTGHLMRILIYLLAMLTGFSVAEAARPVAVAPSALGSAIAQAGAEVTAVSSESQQHAGYLPDSVPSFASVIDVSQIVETVDAPSALSPITRFDISRQ